MNPDHNDTNEWASCPAGLLTGISRVARKRESTRVLGQRVVVGIACSLFLLGSVFAYRSLTTPERQFMGGLACGQVINQMEPFLTGELETGLETRFVHHLQDCPKCRVKYEKRARQLGVELSLAASVGGCVATEGFAAASLDPGSWNAVGIYTPSRPVLASIVPLLR